MLEGIKSNMSIEEKEDLIRRLFAEYNESNNVRVIVLKYLYAMEHHTRDILRRLLRIPDDQTELFGFDETKVLPFDKRFIFLLEICFSADLDRLKELDERMNVLKSLRVQLLASADATTLGDCLQCLKIDKAEFLKYRRQLSPEEQVEELKKTEESLYISALIDLCDHLMYAVVEMISQVTMRYFVEASAKRLNDFVEVAKYAIQFLAKEMQFEIEVALSKERSIKQLNIVGIPNLYELRVRQYVIDFVKNTDMSTEEIFDLIQSQSLAKKYRSTNQSASQKKVKMKRRN